MHSFAQAVVHQPIHYGLDGSSRAHLSYPGQSLRIPHVPQCEVPHLPALSCLTCFSSGLHAHQHPRTDTAIIVGIIDQTGDKILLGRNVRNFSYYLDTC